MTASDGMQSAYYQAIAREFLRRRGASFFLSPRDLAVIAAWEQRRVPLQVALDGIGRAFENARTRARGTKGMSLAFCEIEVERALAQHRDRGAGKGRPAAPRSAKKDRVGREIERYLETAAPGDEALSSLFRKALAALSLPALDEDLLEKTDEDVDRILLARTPVGNRDAAVRKTAGGIAGSGVGEASEVVRTRLIKSARDAGKIPYVSLFYY